MSAPGVKHAVITGGGSGIGAAIAVALAGAGTRVTLMGRRPKALEGVAATLAEARAVSCDVGDEDSVGRSFARAVEHFGPVDILVNNAGIAPTAPFRKLSATAWRQVLATNLDGVFHCTRQVIEPMLERDWGRIVNIASTAAQKGYRYASAYCASKHGVLGLTRALALETATSGITVNAICPGYTDTEIVRDAIARIADGTGRNREEVLGEFTGANPQGRLVRPEEVANAVCWLCASGSEAVTGQAIGVCGAEVT